MRQTVAITLLTIGTLCAHAGHTVIEDTITGSSIYPGTVHTLKVTVPDAYSPQTPAALYLGLDGILCNAPAVLDSLMAVGDIPVTIGVFLQPGVVYGDDGAVLRYNRSNEFDATDDRFATFLATEVLPVVETITTDDGRPIRFSADPRDRTIFGLSSGGIAAFVAAWHRPDLFGKVFSGCGTFVPMRGGNDLEAIVRKHEPLPLRIFLQDGFSDTWNPLFGSWYEHNRLLASALEFAGYDCAFDWAEGGHSVRRATEILPNVLKWLWSSDHDKRPTSNDLLQPLLANDSGWEAIDPNRCPQFASARAVYPDGRLAAAPQSGSNYINQEIIDSEGNSIYSQPFYWLHSYENGALNINSLAYDGDGNLWVLTRAGIQICDQNGRVRGILRLPLDFDAENGKISINDGVVYIIDNKDCYARCIRVTAPVKGSRPASQGQG